MDDEDAPQMVLGWHRVCLNTIVRATKELGSARLRILPMGSRVNVVEVVGRRVRIDEPIDGWCSIESSTGDQILSPTQQDALPELEGVSSPAVDAEQQQMQGRADQLAKELHELKWLRAEVAATKTIQQERDNAQKELSCAQERLKQLEQTHADSQSELNLARAQVQELKSSGDSDEGTGAEQRYQTLIVEKEEVERQLKQIEIIAQNKQKEVENLKKSMEQMASSYNVPSKNTSSKSVLQNGDVVLMQGGDIVILRYVGKVHWDEANEYLGVELSDPIGDCNGTKDGKEYFSCNEKCGMFFLRKTMKKKIPAEFLLQKLHSIMKEKEREKTVQE